jgi:hypothetical protein
MQRFGIVVLGLVILAPAVARCQAKPANDYSGMYSFLRDGEFLQISIEEAKVSGFISRFGDSDSDKGTFLDQFIKSGTFDSGKISFTTEVVHGTFFSFEGSVARGTGKTEADESFYVMRGTLTRFASDPEKKATSQKRQVEFKSFPRDASPN